MSSLNTSKPSKSKKNWQISNSYGCFGIYDLFVMLGVIILFLLPFIDIFIYRFSGNYNTIDWDTYYGDSNSQYSYYTEGEYMNYTSVPSSQFINTLQTFQFKTQYVKTQIPVDKEATKFENISFAFRDYQFFMNGSSDLLFVSQYTFDAKDIYQFYPLMLRLPINILNMYNTSEYSYAFEETVYKVNFNGKPMIFPSNWTSVWDNLDIYFYYVNEQNEGIAFEYGKDQFNGTLKSTELVTDYGILDLDTYSLNISGDLSHKLKYNNLGQLIGYLPEVVYHTSPLSSTSPIKTYSDLYGGILGNGVSFNPDDLMGNLLDYLGLDLAITTIPRGLIYDNQLYEINQLQGFPTNIPKKSSITKCGYYISVKKDFNCSDALNWTNEMGEYKNTHLCNGIEINDDGLYLGRILPLNQLLTRIGIYDLIIFGSYLGIIITYIYVSKTPQKYKEFKTHQETYCQKPKLK